MSVWRVTTTLITGEKQIAYYESKKWAEYWAAMERTQSACNEDGWQKYAGASWEIEEVER